MEQVTGNGFERWKHRWCRLLRNRTIALCLAVFQALLLPSTCAAADESLEYQVKAAFLLNFTKFVEWPPAAFEATDSPIAICILGEDPFGAALDQMVAGEVVSGRKLAVRRLKGAPAPKSCQALFIGKADKEALKIPAGQGAGVLTIGEGEAFVREGGMIAFVLDNRRVRFSINQSAAENAGLKLSSKLLSVARSVEK
jgi:YfiR/HmsC-like